jgi:DNA-binding protein HU-beta
MTKEQLVSIIQEKVGLKTRSEAEKAVNGVISAITEGLAAGEKITFTGFGTFQSCERKERTGRNPRTGETLKIAACKAIKFTPGKNLKGQVS